MRAQIGRRGAESRVRSYATLEAGNPGAVRNDANDHLIPCIVVRLFIEFCRGRYGAVAANSKLILSGPSVECLETGRQGWMAGLSRPPVRADDIDRLQPRSSTWSRANSERALLMRPALPALQEFSRSRNLAEIARAFGTAPRASTTPCWR